MKKHETSGIVIALAFASPLVIAGMEMLKLSTNLFIGMIIGWVSFAACAVWAGPPFRTDDPETPQWHGWEINIPFTSERTKDKWAVQMPLFDINYGVRPNVQLKLEFPLFYVHPIGDGHQFGLGDTLVGIKWRFLEERTRRPQLAFYPQVVLPTGDSKRGLGDGKPSFLIPLVGQKSWDNWTLYGNLGYTVQTAKDSRNFWYSGFVLSRDIGERLNLATELFWNTRKEAGGRSEYAFNFGGQLMLTDRYYLLFSAGRSFLEGPSFFSYLGIRIVTKGIGKRQGAEQKDSEKK